MDYQNILKYIKVNSVNKSRDKLIDGLPESVSFSLSIVAHIFDKEIISVINDYADIK